MKTLAALTLKAKIIIAAASAAVVAAGAVGTVMLLNNKEESYRVVKECKCELWVVFQFFNPTK